MERITDIDDRLLRRSADNYVPRQDLKNPRKIVKPNSKVDQRLSSKPCRQTSLVHCLDLADSPAAADRTVFSKQTCPRRCMRVKTDVKFIMATIGPRARGWYTRSRYLWRTTTTCYQPILIGYSLSWIHPRARSTYDIC